LQKVSLLLGVYALHLFLFVGFSVLSSPSFASAVHIRFPAGNHSSHHDAASTECRSLFKYDDSKQQVHVDDFPLVFNDKAVFYSDRHYLTVLSSGFQSFICSDVSYRRYCLLKVFLI
jgi:hypothetical protein